MTRLSVYYRDMYAFSVRQSSKKTGSFLRVTIPTQKSPKSAWRRQSAAL